jgi:hypothetical protein
MAKWLYKVKLKHVLTEDTDHETVQKNMIAIAKIIESKKCFFGFDTKRFYEVPKGDGVMEPEDFANKLIERIYDFADLHKIWIE